MRDEMRTRKKSDTITKINSAKLINFANSSIRPPVKHVSRELEILGRERLRVRGFHIEQQ